MLLAASCGQEAEPSPAKNGDTSPKPQRPIKVDFEALAAWNFELGENTPEKVEKLNGNMVEITGYIYPTRQTRNIREFILMKDLGTCCYGPKTQWTHFLQVEIPKDQDPVNYSTDPITVTGKFRLEPEKEDGYIMGLYYLDATAHRIAPGRKARPHNIATSRCCSSRRVPRSPREYSSGTQKGSSRTTKRRDGS